MSGEKCQHQAGQEADISVQGPRLFDSTVLPDPFFSLEGNQYEPKNKQGQQQDLHFSSSDVTSFSQANPKTHSVKNVRANTDQPLDLTVKKGGISEERSKQLLLQTVPTIFSSNPEAIFKIPLPPELGQGPSSNNKNSRLSKAVNQTFEFRHKVPFLAKCPSIFQLKYNLFANPEKRSSSKYERISTLVPPFPQQYTIKHKFELDMAASSAPQKQARMQKDACGEFSSYKVKDEPMDDVDPYHNHFHLKSAEGATGLSRNPSFSSGRPFVSNGSQISESCSFVPGKETRKMQQYHLPDSSSDMVHQNPLFYPPTSSDTSFDENMVRQSSTADSYQKHVPSSGLGKHTDVSLCQVCGDQAAGFYCGAYICEACKKFFIRASKLKQIKYVCLKQKKCSITKESRVHCQYCRYQKCLSLQMFYLKDGHKGEDKSKVQEIPCRVCSAPSSGFHFGALTCEGCKGFFRRMVNEREPYTYRCGKGGNCEVNSMTRNICKACRYAKCLQIGMCIQGSRIGRQPNAVKHAISLEVKKQAARRESSQERKSHSFTSVCEDSDSSICSLESHVLESCPAEEVNKLVSLDKKPDQSIMSQISAPEKRSFSERQSANRSMVDHNWRESREREKMASSSTESLDLVGRTDTNLTNLDEANQSEMNERELKWEEHKHKQGGFYHDCQLKEEGSKLLSESRYGHSFGTNPGTSSIKNSYMLNQFSQSREPHKHYNPEFQVQPQPVAEMLQYPLVNNDVSGTRGFFQDHTRPTSVFPHARRFSEDLELLNLNISMHRDESACHDGPANSYQKRGKVLGMAFSGSLPSSWDPKEDNNHRYRSMKQSNLSSSSPYSTQNVLPQSCNMTSNQHNVYHQRSLSAEDKQTKNLYNMDRDRFQGSLNPPFAGQPEFQSMSQHPFNQAGSVSSHNFSPLDKGELIMPLLIQTTPQSHYAHAGSSDVKKDVQISQHPPIQGQQVDYSHYNYRPVEALQCMSIDTGAQPSPNSNKRSLNLSEQSYPQGFDAPQASESVMHEQRLEHQPKRRSSFTVVEGIHQARPNNMADGFQGNTAAVPNTEKEQSFKIPGSLGNRENSHWSSHNPTPSNDRKNRRWSQESRSPSPYNNPWRYRQESQGSRSPSPHNTRGIYRHDSDGSRTPSPCNSGGNYQQDCFATAMCNGQDQIGALGSNPNVHNSVSVSPAAPTEAPVPSDADPMADIPPVASAAGPGSTTDQINSPTTGLSHPSTSKSLPQSNGLIPSGEKSSFPKNEDLDMEVAAKCLKSICLVEDAKRDIYHAESFESREVAWEIMMEHFDFHAKWMVRYAKKVPGFRNIRLNDQVTLLSKATYNLVLLNHSRAYEPETGFYNYFNMTRKDWEKSLEYFPEFQVLHTHFKHCGILAKELGLTEIEYAYLSSLMLLDDECEGLEDVKEVEKLKETFMAAFQRYELDNFPNGSLRFGQMLLRMSEFSQFSMQHNVAVVQVITKNPHLHIPQLYAEMYNQSPDLCHQ